MALGFTMIILMPLLLFAATLYGFSQSQAQKAQAVTESDGTVYDISITDSADSQGRVHVMAKDLFISAFVILISVALVVGLWVYRSIAVPLVKLKKATQNIKEGNLDFVLDVEGKDEFSELCQDFEEMRRRLKESTEEKSLIEKENRELISNISHDLKTPLTSIINYVDLLKRKNFTDQEVLKYLDILDSKSHRLKSLTEDVVEASKASTGNLSLEMSDLNFVEMLYQVMGEFEERLEDRHLTLMTHFPDTPAMIFADGRRMWRVLENLFGNVLKYAMENTRVYAEVLLKNNQIIFTLKNISAQPLNIPVEELTERFIRGDVARNTEGSGLGLSIAQSLTQLQGGTFNLYLDGDLFKVCLSFPQKISPTALSGPDESHS